LHSWMRILDAYRVNSGQVIPPYLRISIHDIINVCMGRAAPYAVGWEFMTSLVSILDRRFPHTAGSAFMTFPMSTWAELHLMQLDMNS